MWNRGKIAIKAATFKDFLSGVSISDTDSGAEGFDNAFISEKGTSDKSPRSDNPLPRNLFLVETPQGCHICIMAYRREQVTGNTGASILPHTNTHYVCVNSGRFNFHLPYSIFCLPLKNWMFHRPPLTTYKLEWLEHWGRLAELELKWSTHELVYVGNTSATQST